MTDGRTYWHLDQTTVHVCGDQLRVYTDGRKTYAHCPVCDQKVELGDFGKTYRVNTGQSKSEQVYKYAKKRSQEIQNGEKQSKEAKP